MVTTIAEILPQAARKHGDRVALIIDSRRLTFRQLDALSNRVANGLVASGVQPGDRVSLFGPNSWEWLVSYYGIVKSGAVVNPLSSMLTAGRGAIRGHRHGGERSDRIARQGGAAPRAQGRGSPVQPRPVGRRARRRRDTAPRMAGRRELRIRRPSAAAVRPRGDLLYLGHNGSPQGGDAKPAGRRRVPRWARR